MTRHEWQLTASGRYSRLSRPIGSPEPELSILSPSTRFVNSVHSRTLLFLMFAVLVGFGLLKIVPALSASASGVARAAPDDASRIGSYGAEAATDPKSLETADSWPTVSAQSDVTASDTYPVSNSISPVFTREVQYWEPKILEWAKLYDLDPDIIATIMQIESCGDPGAASHAGAQGLFQVMPFHFENGEDMLNPDTNAMRGMAFYNRQLDYTGRDIYLSFAGYNGGYAASGSSFSYWASETQRYYTWAKGIFDEAKAGLAESPTLQQWLQAGGASGCQRAAQRLGL